MFLDTIHHTAFYQFKQFIRLQLFSNEFDREFELFLNLSVYTEGGGAQKGERVTRKAHICIST